MLKRPLGFIEQIIASNRCSVATNSMSTQITGESTDVFDSVRQALETSYEAFGRQVLVAKFIPEHTLTWSHQPPNDPPRNDSGGSGARLHRAGYAAESFVLGGCDYQRRHLHRDLYRGEALHGGGPSAGLHRHGNSGLDLLG